MNQFISIIGNGKHYLGKDIKRVVIEYVESKSFGDFDEIIEFYVNYVEGREYFPISDSTYYRLDWCKSSILPTPKD